MTLAQTIRKRLYPLLMQLQPGKKISCRNIFNAKPIQPLYQLKSTVNNGQEFDFETLRGKKIMIVNTASNCGYTNQYSELEKLYEANKDELVILGFPSNDFGEQEKGDNSEIAQFCKINFGVSFPLMQKSVVKKQSAQNEVYQWLADAGLNGWNNQAPVWNFSKYLINEDGVLTNFFGPTISPLSDEVAKALL